VKITRRKHVEWRSYVEIDGYEVSLNHMLGLLDELEDSWDYMSATWVVIDDQKLIDTLVDRDVLTQTARGGRYRSDGFQAFYDEVQEAAQR
jgi:hypothetical protein